MRFDSDFLSVVHCGIGPELFIFVHVMIQIL